MPSARAHDATESVVQPSWTRGSGGGPRDRSVEIEVAKPNSWAPELFFIRSPLSPLASSNIKSKYTEKFRASPS